MAVVKAAGQLWEIRGMEPLNLMQTAGLNHPRGLIPKSFTNSLSANKDYKM